LLSVSDSLTVRARQIVRVARRLLESEGPKALTMRRVADQLNIRAPSLYKHFPDKEALEVAIIVDGFEEAAAKFEAAEADTADPWATFAATYRDFATSHPHVYRLMTERPLPREQLPAGLEATGDPVRARAAWAFLHGLTMLELNGRLPFDDLTEPAWQIGIQQFRLTPHKSGDNGR
jgi:AcrR family transcriptional regulator